MDFVRIRDLRYDASESISVKAIVWDVFSEQDKEIIHIRDDCRDAGETIVVITVSRTGNDFRRIEKGDRVECRNFKLGPQYKNGQMRNSSTECTFSLYFEEGLSYFQANDGQSGITKATLGTAFSNTTTIPSTFTRDEVGNERTPTRSSININYLRNSPNNNRMGLGNSNTPQNQRVTPPPPYLQSLPQQQTQNQNITIPNVPLRVRRERTPENVYTFNNQISFTRIRDLQENQSNCHVCAIVKEYWYSRILRGRAFIRANIFDDVENPNSTIQIFHQYDDFDRLPQIKNVGQVIIIKNPHIGRYKGNLQITFDNRKVNVLPSPRAERLRDLPGRMVDHRPIPQWRIVPNHHQRRRGRGFDRGRRTSRSYGGYEVIQLSNEEQSYVHRLQQDSMRYFSHPRSVYDYSQRDVLARRPKYLKSFSCIPKHHLLQNPLMGHPMINHGTNNQNSNVNWNMQLGPSTTNRQQQQSNSDFCDYAARVIIKDERDPSIRGVPPFRLVLWDGTVPPNKPIFHRRTKDHELPIRYPLRRTRREEGGEEVEFEYTNQKNPPNMDVGDPRGVMEVKVKDDNLGFVHQIDSLVEVGEWVMIRNVFHDMGDSRLQVQASIMGLAPWDYRVVRMEQRLNIGYLYVRSEINVAKVREEKNDFMWKDHIPSIPEILEKVNVLGNVKIRFKTLVAGKITVFRKENVTDFCRLKCDSCNYFFSREDEAGFRTNGNINEHQVLRCSRCGSLDCSWRYDFQFRITDPAVTPGTANNLLRISAVGDEGEKFFGRPARDLFGPNSAVVVEKMMEKIELLKKSGQRFNMKLLVRSDPNNPVVHYYLLDTKVTCETNEYVI